MAEYVVEGAEPNETVLHSRTPNGYEEWQWLPVRERIVRCKDCKRVTIDQGDHDYRDDQARTIPPYGNYAFGGVFV